MWPASALLTGNGVAFILRVPGTEHGDWWSMNGWWIFAGTSAISLLSKYLIRVRGRHVFNPSNFGLVLCFLLLGASRADPLALWWGPLSPSLVFALVLIVVGGFLILRRLHLVGVAVGFWVAFAAGIALLAASGHTMTAPWHVGPIEGREFWWLLVTSPEILVFLFFMITDPKTIPASRTRPAGLCGLRRAAGDRSDRAADDRVRDQGRDPRRALRRLCNPRGDRAGRRGAARLTRAADAATTRRRVGRARRRSRVCGARRRGRCPGASGGRLRRRLATAFRRFRRSMWSTRRASPRSTRRLRRQSRATSSSTCAPSSQALRARDEDLAADAASRDVARGALERHERRGHDHGGRSTTSTGCELRLRRSDGQAAPHVVARLEGTQTTSAFAGSGTTQVAATAPQPFTRTLMLVLEGGTLPHRRVRGRRAARWGERRPSRRRAGDLGGTTFLRRRASRRARLPARRVQVRDVVRHDGDDGRRSLLARLRRGRLARPLRRQLVRATSTSLLRTRTAACPGARSTATSAVASRTSARAPAPTSRCAGTAASRRTSTSTATPIST